MEEAQLSKIMLVEKVATRYDNSQICKTEKTPEGYLFCEAVFARDGILEYRLPSGQVRRELRLPETNYSEETLVSYGSKPLTIEHPPILLDSRNVQQYQVGTSDPIPVYEKRYDKGFVGGVVRIYRQDAIDLIESGAKKEISIGYTTDIDETPGVWNGERYDAVQRNVRVNHIAITAKGRAGSDVCLKLDSADNDIAFASLDVPKFDSISTRKQRMTNIRIDGIEFQDVPESLAIVMSQKLKELEGYKSRLDSQFSDSAQLSTEVSQLKEQLDTAQDECDRQRGRADALEIQLEELRWDLEQRSDSDRIDMDEEDEEEEDYEDEEEEEMPPPKKSKRKHKKIMHKDSDDDYWDDDEDESGSNFDSDDDEDFEDEDDMSLYNEEYDRADSELWQQAEILIPGFFSRRFDSEASATDVRVAVLQQIAPNTRLDGKSPEYVEGLFESLVENAQSRNDGILDSMPPELPSELSSVIGAARASGTHSPLSAAQSQRSQEVSQNWQKPLSMSRN